MPISSRDSLNSTAGFDEPGLYLASIDVDIEFVADSDRLFVVGVGVKRIGDIHSAA